MNLTEMVNGLNRMDNVQPFSPHAYILAAKIIERLNWLRWPATVSISMSQMVSMAKCSSRSTAKDARDELIERSLLVIVREGRKGSPTEYRMIDLGSQFGIKNKPNPGRNPALGAKCGTECGSKNSPNPGQNPGDIHIINNNIKDKTYNRQSSNRVLDKKESESVKEFIPPTLEEIHAYCHEKGYRTNVTRFFGYYKSVGWKVKGQPVEDWQALLDTWVSRDCEFGAVTPPQYDSDDDMDDWD